MDLSGRTARNTALKLSAGCLGYQEAVTTALQLENKVTEARRMNFS
jgi:hypothetical protein